MCANGACLYFFTHLPFLSSHFSLDLHVTHFLCLESQCCPCAQVLALFALLLFEEEVLLTHDPSSELYVCPVGQLGAEILG